MVVIALFGLINFVAFELHGYLRPARLRRSPLCSRPPTTSAMGLAASSSDHPALPPRTEALDAKLANLSTWLKLDDESKLVLNESPLYAYHYEGHRESRDKADAIYLLTDKRFIKVVNERISTEIFLKTVRHVDVASADLVLSVRFQENTIGIAFAFSSWNTASCAVADLYARTISCHLATITSNL